MDHFLNGFFSGGLNQLIKTCARAGGDDVARVRQTAAQHKDAENGQF
jgi:hypothetical protein